MPTVINTNLASLYAQNNLSNAQNSLANSVRALSSGLRISSAKDDAAGLAISQSMQDQINGVNQARRNMNDAVNLIQVADTSMGTIHDMLLRLKTLATQGYDGSLSASQRTQIVDEINELNAEINNTAARTKFNGNALIAATVGRSSGTASVGAATGTLASITGISINTTGVGTFLLTGTSLSTSTGSVVLSGTISNTYSGTAFSTTYAQTLTATSYSATAKGIQVFNFDKIGISIEVTQTGAASTGNLLAVGLNALTVTTAAGAPSDLYFQGGTETSTPNMVIYDAINVRTDYMGDTNSTLAGFDAMTNLGGQIQLLNSYANTVGQSTWATAFSTLGTFIDTAIDKISEERSNMGALQNRISYINQNLEAYSTNLQASRSAIMDADFAAETAKLTKGQILQQAATAMLAQANQMNNVVLSLLK
ncbi:MAG: flagellin [Betaproteobacteria bacterium]|nr:flagellin [Betaproteobacteria bacterium]